MFFMRLVTAKISKFATHVQFIHVQFKDFSYIVNTQIVNCLDNAYISPTKHPSNELIITFRLWKYTLVSWKYTLVSLKYTFRSWKYTLVSLKYTFLTWKYTFRLWKYTIMTKPVPINLKNQ